MELHADDRMLAMRDRHHLAVVPRRGDHTKSRWKRILRDDQRVIARDAKR